MAVSVVSALLAVATPVLAGKVVDEIVGGGAPAVVVMLAAVIAAVAVAEAAVSLVTRWLSSTIGEGLILDLRTAVFDHVQRMPVAFFTRTRTGALVSRLGNDVIGAQRAFSDTLSGVVSNLVTLTLTLVVMLCISWQITLLSLVLMPLFVLPARRIGAHDGAVVPRGRDQQRDDEHPDDRTVLGAGRDAGQAVRQPGHANRDEFAARAGRVRDIGVRTAMLQSTFMNSLTLMSALALALVYGLGGVLAIGGHLQAGAIVSLALLLTRLYAPLTALANAHVEIASALVSFERVFEVLDLVPLIQERPGAVAVPDGAGVRRVRRRAVRLPVGRQGVAGLAGGGRGTRLTAAETKCCTAFRSPRGPARWSRWSGRRGGQVDDRVAAGPAVRRRLRCACGLNGVDVRDVTFASLKDTVGMVTQDGHLFHESIRSNLLLAAPDATDDELWEALERARLADVVADMPDGLDTVVGERGYRLSGGQRQRLTIARLLLGRSRVVVLDEATASLDSESEAAVQQALGEALAGRTSIVIAHRLSTVRAADVILVVEDGRIVERGTHEQLLARGGRYAELYETQFGSQDEAVAA